MDNPMSLDPTKIPRELITLIPMAEKWGISDDGYRDDAVEEASIKELWELAHCLDDYDGKFFENWLAGPEADNPVSSAEYIAFSAFLMSVDLARIKLKRINH